MADELFMELLLKLSVPRLRELRALAEEKLELARVEAHYLDRALEEKGATVSGDRSDAQPKRPAAPRPKAKPAPSSKREPIERIVTSDPHRIWLPSEVRDLLINEGIETSAGNVRATMRRMLDEGALVRPSDGGHGFLLAPNNGSSSEPRGDAHPAAGGYGESP